jgi:hypothetical protein
MANPKKSPADVKEPPAIPGLAADHPLNRSRATSARRIDPGDWVKFDKIGDGVVGKVLRINPPTDRIKRGSFDLLLPDMETIVPVGKGGTLGTMIREDLVGHWIGVFYVDTKPAEGKPQPTKVYEVHDFMHECPVWAADEYGALPDD